MSKSVRCFKLFLLTSATVASFSLSFALKSDQASAAVPQEVETALQDANTMMSRMGGLTTAAFAAGLAPIGGMMVFKFIHRLVDRA